MKYKITKHEIGYYFIDPLPNKKELKEYYSKKYYQNLEVATYSKEYSQDEMNVLKIDGHISDYIYNEHFKSETKNLIDVACGEGFFMKFMKSYGWNVSGIDFSNEGIKNHNSQLLDKIETDDVLKNLKKLIKKNKTFQFINLGNILEHVINPNELLRDCYKLMTNNAILRIKVPNDFSDLQNLLEKNNLNDKKWVCPPDHLSYFNFKSLRNICEHNNLKIVKEIGDFPIEIYLANKYSNYYINDNGSESHNARITLTNLIFNKGLDKYLKWAEGLASAEISRSCTFFCQKRNDNPK